MTYTRNIQTDYFSDTQNRKLYSAADRKSCCKRHAIVFSWQEIGSQPLRSSGGDKTWRDVLQVGHQPNRATLKSP